jgi:hypothetical protein
MNNEVGRTNDAQNVSGLNTLGQNRGRCGGIVSQRRQNIGDLNGDFMRGISSPITSKSVFPLDERASALGAERD